MTVSEWRCSIKSNIGKQKNGSIKVKKWKSLSVKHTEKVIEFKRQNERMFRMKNMALKKKLKEKNAIKRCLLLYSYGVEVQKANQANISQNKIHKEKEELKLCTWRPKLNNYKNKNNKKISKNKNAKENKIKNDIKLDKRN